MSDESDTLAVAWPLRAIKDWSLWWNEKSLFQKLLPALCVGIYWLALLALKGFRGDHVAIGVVLLVLSYGGRGANRIRSFAMPFLLTAIIYDSMRFYAEYIRGPIHVEEPYLFDKTFFGITTEQGVLTPNEWWQQHLHWSLDLITGFAYLVFFAIFILTTAYFQFWVGRKGTAELTPAQASAMASRMGWAFLFVNLLGYSTYYWYAAAPPWYVAIYGLGPAHLDAPANVAGCGRFDQLLGTHFFSEMYGRAADVFGAIPSLHVAYPLMAAIYSVRFKRLRAFSICFYLLMCFSAVYLNHHYILDIIWGSTYTVIVAWLMERYGSRRANA